MFTNIETGKKGEDLAKAYFLLKGYKILAMNWRYGSHELDIIACHNGFVHFIEVKTRTGKMYGYPDDNVTKKKIQSMMCAAEAWLVRNPKWKRIQYDILAIEIIENNPVYTLIEDVYVW